jgi:DNA processing protein
MGAQLVTESNDILNDLNIVPQSQLDEIPKADNPAEGIVLGILSSNPLSADELIQRSGLDAALLTTTLTFLEMKGRIKNLGAQQYIRSR